MSAGAVTSFVFVDFENVPSVDLALIRGKTVHVTLLIGKKQTKIDTNLSLQLHEYAAQVTPVRVEASGRNALDMILACYLGQAIEQHPHAPLFVVSKDKDFEPLLAHLKAKGIRVTRHDAFAALPFLNPPVSHTAKSKAVARPPAAKPAGKATPANKQPDRFAKLVTHLRNSPTTKLEKLTHLIESFYKAHLPVSGVPGIINLLRQKKVISVEGTSITVHPG